jgi:hypothetical protein
MRQTNTKLLAEPKPLGVVDAVSAGLDLVRKRPWTLAIPLLFDLAIWLFPRLSLARMVRPWAEVWMSAALAAGDAAAAEETRLSLLALVDSFNLVGFVVTALNAITRLPSLLALGASDVRSPITSWAYIVPVESPAVAALLFIPLFLTGLFLAAVYLEWLAQGVRPLESAPQGALVARVGRLYLRLLLLALVLLAIVLGASILLGILDVLTGSVELVTFASVVISIGIVWLVIYFFFLPAALAVSDIGVRDAFRRSILLFRVFFWATIGLVALSFFLDQGLTIIWEALLGSSTGVALAILANAFIGTGLLAASMVYYQDRLNMLERLRARARAARS